MTLGEFFETCRRHGLVDTNSISKTFTLNQATVRKWRSLPEDSPVTRLIDLSCLAIDAHGPTFSPDTMTFETFMDFRKRHELTSFRKVGDVFGLGAPGVHAWYARTRLPRTLALACAGYEVLISR